MKHYSKAIVATLGAAITTLLGLIPESSILWVILTVLAAALTSLSTYIVPNGPKVQEDI